MLFLTPRRLSTIYPQLPSTCWRDCGQTGTCSGHAHGWPLHGLSEIAKMINDLTQLNITLTPQLETLNITIDVIPPQLRLVITHMLLATRLLIARNWKTSNIPTVADVVALVQTHYTYESMMSRGNSSHSKLANLWVPWEHWYTKYVTTLWDLVDSWWSILPNITSELYYIID